MPLPFLTADRATRPPAGSIALPHTDVDRWRRPYRPGPWRVGVAAVLLLLSSFMLISTVIIAATRGAGEAAPVAVGTTAVIVVSLRLLRVGTWVSRRGLRRVGFLWTTTDPWQRIASVRTVQQPVRWLGLPRTVQGQALTLVQHGAGGGPGRGGQAPIVLMTDHDADFLARTEAFDRAADTVEAWYAEYARR